MDHILLFCTYFSVGKQNSSGRQAVILLLMSHYTISFGGMLHAYFQLQVEASGQVTIPCMKLSNGGILGLEDELAMVTDYQYGGKTMCGVVIGKLGRKKSNLAHFTKPCNLKRVTYFDFSKSLIHCGHLEQLAVACPNLQKLNLADCYI